MRISSTLFFRTGLNSINAQQSDLLNIYQQMGSGKRMVTPSDDPLAAAQAINISQSQSLNARYTENRNVIKQSLNSEETSLKSVVSSLQDVKTQLIGAGNGVLSDADRRSLADALKSAKSTVLAQANATDGNGQYIYSGYQGDQKPFSDSGDWNGFSGQRLVQVDQTRQLSGSDLGSDVFARVTPGSQKYLTAAGSANAGTGQIASPSITDPTGEFVGAIFEITFVADPADPDPANPTLPAQYQITVKDASGNPVSTSATLPDNPTLPQAYDAEQGVISLPGGVSVALSGQPVIGDTFSATPASSLSSSDMNIFKSFDDIIAALDSNTLDGTDPVAVANLRNAVNSALQRFDVHYDNVLTIQSSVGARLAEVSAIDENGTSRGLSYSKRLTQLENIDYYTASTQLQLRTAALEAAALAFKKIQSASILSISS